MDYLKKLLKHYKTATAAAAAIELTPAAVSAFKRRGRVPIEWQVRWEAATAGAVKADLPDGLRCQCGRVRP